MRQRQTLTDNLRPFRHAEEWKNEPGEQHIWQKEHRRHLHRLKLILCECRERVTKRQVGRDKQSGQRYKQGKIGGNISVTDNPGIWTNQASIPDPYADRTIPSMPAASGPNKWSGAVHNTGSGNPPVMTINGNVDVKGNTTLDPGIYIINKLQ